MTLEPQAADLIAMVNDLNLPSFEEAGYEKSRIGFEERATSSAFTEVGSVTDETIPGPDGNDIPIRIYTPTAEARSPHGTAGGNAGTGEPGTGKPGTGLVYFHGGGWVVGNINTHDGACRMLTQFAGAVTVSVDYRLAPEHRFPAPVEDCYAATQWVSANADRLGINPAALVVGGDSAGGNLAAAVAQMCRDRATAPLAMQLLIYPATAFDRDTASMRANAEGYLLTQSTMRWFDDLYLPEQEQARAQASTNPYAAPLECDDLAGLAPAVVIVAGHDPLCDEGVAYANKLSQAGVPTTLLEYPGQFHGFFTMTKFLDQATQANYLASALIRSIAGG